MTSVLARRLLLGIAWCGAAQACARLDYERVHSERIEPEAAHCTNQRLDGDESGTDCGGSCAPCPQGNACTDPSDCDSANCLESTCQVVSCSDAIQNQDETGIDCGGSCPPCETCSDGIRNQDETGIDCGGATCSPCETCSDSLQNQDETGIDCGGATCGPCESCSDRLQNQDETGIDCGGSVCSGCGVNTPPVARMVVTPGVGSHDGTPATLFQADGGATTDREDPANALTYAWDWDNDGTTDATGPTSTHTYSTGGTFEARLIVQDSGGLTDVATFLVIVNSDSNVVRVTTAVDENDAGATVASPGGTGLSLREAIAFTNSSAGRQSIFVPAGFAIALSSELPSPSDPLGVDIVGDGALLDGGATSASDDCVLIDGAQNHIFGFEIQSCQRSPIRLAATASDSHLSRLNVHDNAQPVILNGANTRFGPDNEVSRSNGYGVSLLGASSTIDRNYIHDCAARGIDLTGTSDGALVLGNVIARCSPGILFGNASDDTRVLHNVLHANAADGINAGTTSSGVVMRNNIFSGNIGYGLRANEGIFAANDHNDYFGNTVGTCTACALGTGSLTLDPRYMDASADDFRLQASSPNVDAGIDTAEDVNGPTPGNGSFNGANPDIGARESP